MLSLSLEGSLAAHSAVIRLSRVPGSNRLLKRQRGKEQIKQSVAGGLLVV